MYVHAFISVVQDTSVMFLSMDAYIKFKEFGTVTAFGKQIYQ